MAKNDNLTDFLADVANAIREKKGTTDLINPQDFSAEIASIETGGGDTPTPDMPVIGDGKTYLYIKIAGNGRMVVSLYFSQSVANGVTIDWGDGSATQTLSGTGYKNVTHTYAEIGEYTISLNPSSGCILDFGSGSSAYCVMGDTGNNGRVYCNMLQAVEIGKNVTSIGDNAFRYCSSLASVVIPDSVTSIGSSVFSNCSSLASVIIPDGATSIGSSVFSNCSSLASVVIPDSVTSIGNNAFYCCYGMAYYDFRASKSVPTLSNKTAFNSISSDCEIVVPDSLYDTWKAATNWSSYASKIVKASEFNG